MPHDHSKHRQRSRLDQRDEPAPDKPLGRDERVSFYPMQPDEVLRKLLRTPPPGRAQDKQAGDRDSAQG